MLEVTAVNNKKTAEKALAELMGGLEKIRTDFTELKQAVSTKLQPLGITEIPFRTPPGLSFIPSMTKPRNSIQKYCTI